MVHLRARTAGRMRIRQRQLLIILTTLKKAQTNFSRLWAALPVFAKRSNWQDWHICQLCNFLWIFFQMRVTHLCVLKVGGQSLPKFVHECDLKIGKQLQSCTCCKVHALKSSVETSTSGTGYTTQAQ